MPVSVIVIWILVLLTAVGYLLLLLYLCWHWMRSRTYQSPVKQPVACISVIIAARNEADRIAACLESLCKQTLPQAQFEVILVDDHSEDDTIKVAAQFESRLPLHIISLAGTTQTGKKAAITAGIERSRFALILTTDADTSAGINWLQTIAAFYETTNAKMIVAPVLYNSGFHFFSMLQSLEIAGLALVTGAATAAGKPLMANGANLAYEKKIFYETKGFENDPYTSGDDLLLLQRVYQLYPGGIYFLKSRAATVFTGAQKTISGFFNQRKRWASKYRAFRLPFLKAAAFLVFFINLLVLLLAAGGCASGKLVEPFLVLICTKISIDFLLLSLAASFFGKRHLLFVFLIALPCYSLYVVASAAGGMGGSFRWKGRLTKK